MSMLDRHVRGDFGVSVPGDDGHDRAVNAWAARSGIGRVHSAYPIDPDKPCLGYGANTVWVITEFGVPGLGTDTRTTIILPEEY
jgi:hypothetical protein